MIDERVIEGTWWLPEKPGESQAGTLRASGDSVRLNLIGSFRDLVAGTTGAAEVYPLILGLGDGKLVTLTNCFESSFKFSAPGILKQDLIAHRAFVGAHLRDERIVRLSLGTTHLAEWAEPPVLFPNPMNADEVSSVEIKYALPPDVECSVGGDRVRLAYGWSTSGERFRSIKLKQIVSFDVQLAEPTEFDVVEQRFAYPMQNLLTLGTNAPNAITELHVWPAPASEVEASQGPVETFYPAVFKASEPSKSLHPQEPFFRLRDMAANFCQFMARWLEMSEDLGSVLGLFFSNRYAPPQFTNTRFLIYCQAAELFHRRTAPGEAEDPTAHAARVSVLLSGAPDDHREWLTRALAHTNEKRLRQRLRELVDRMGPILGDIVGDPSVFVQDVVATRNYFTHWDPEGKAGAASGVRLHELSEGLRLILQVGLMLELGFSQEECQRLAGENRTVQWMRSGASQKGAES